MRNGRGVFLCLVLVSALLAPGCESAHETVKKVKVKGHTRDGKTFEKKFDLEIQDQADELADLVMKGHVHHVTPDEPVGIMDLKGELGLWTLVIFLLLFFILKKAAWGPMLEGLKKREENIRTAAEEARRTREEMERIKVEFQTELARAHEQIPRLMDEARRDAQRLAEEMKAKAQGEIQTDRQRLRREIELAKEQALQEIYQQGAQLATLISAKVIQRALSEDDHRRLVDDALAELRQFGR